MIKQSIKKVLPTNLIWFLVLINELVFLIKINIIKSNRLFITKKESEFEIDFRKLVDAPDAK